LRGAVGRQRAAGASGAGGTAPGRADPRVGGGGRALGPAGPGPGRWRVGGRRLVRGGRGAATRGERRRRRGPGPRPAAAGRGSGPGAGGGLGGGWWPRCWMAVS